jgi:hypothetical protein
LNDWLDFFSSVIHSLAWPAAIVLVVLLLRTELRDVILRIRRLRAAGVEVEVGEKIEEIERRAEEVLPPIVPAATGRDEEQLQTSANLSPRGAVLDSWLALEDEIRAAATRAGIDVTSRSSVGWLLGELQRRERIKPELRAMIEDLRAVRNAAAHSRDFDLSPGRALEYATLARRLANLFDLLAADLTSVPQ